MAPHAEIAAFCSGRAALESMRARRAGLAILSIEAPDIDGLDLLPQVRAERLARRLIVLAARRDHRTLAALSATGFHGFVDVRSAVSGELELAIQCVLGGGRHLGADAAARFAAAARARRAFPLSRHDELVLSVLGEGMGNEAAAIWLGLSPGTVRNHRMRIKKQLGLQTSSELQLYAWEHAYVRRGLSGLLHPGFEAELEQLWLEAGRDLPLPAPACVVIESPPPARAIRKPGQA